MCKKLLLVKYLGFNPEGELCTIGQSYPYTVETRKKVSPQDFVVLTDESQNEDRNAVSTVRVMGVLNKDRNAVSIVRVMGVLNDDATDEEVDKALAKCNYRKPRDKIFVGKAELGDYFAEADKKRKREEITQKLEQRFKEAEKMALYQKLAETDSEMKGLLDELEALK